MQSLPKRIAVLWTQATGKLQRERPVAGANQIFSQLNFVRREDSDAAPTARNGDIPLLSVGCRLDSGIGKKNVIHRLALRTIGRDRIAGKKFPKTFIQNAAIVKH